MTQLSVSITDNTQKEFSPGTCLNHEDMIRLSDQEVLLRTTEHVEIELSIPRGRGQRTEVTILLFSSALGSTTAPIMLVR